MRHLPLHRWMLRLALAAITLMVLVPSLGRLAGTGPATGAAHAMHASGGHDAHKGGHRTHHSHGTPTAPAAPQPVGIAHYDCGYCPLLASMVPSALAHIAWSTGHRNARMVVGAAEPRLPWRHPWGLGSRGPPTA